MATFAVRLSEEERSKIDRLAERLAEREKPYVRLTDRYVLMASLEALEKRLDELDRDRERKR